jgi:hypothetical protein
VDREVTAPATGDSLPVVVGVGSFTHHPDGIGSTMEPVEVIAAAISGALADAGIADAGRTRVDGLFLSHLASWRYPDPVGAACAAAGLSPAARRQAPSGGDQPTRLLVAAAEAVSSGELALVVVAGGEAARSRRWFDANRTEPDWPTPSAPPGPRMNGLRTEDRAHGLTAPRSVYPLFEVARRARFDATPELGQRRAATIQARMSAVAAGVDGAWSPRAHSAASLLGAGGANRWVSWPYTRLMCANPAVDQAGAAVVTTVGFARRHGLTGRPVHVWGAAGGDDPFTVLTRADLGDSTGLARTLDGVGRIAGRRVGEFDHVEFYSCFPIVPWTAASHVGWAEDRDLSVAGGLTFYGGPASSYANCAVTAMVRRLRSAGPGRVALVHGNGLFMTRHHAVVLSTDPPPRFPAARVLPPDPPADGPVPLTVDPAGPCEVETCTALADAGGAWVRGVVVGRDAHGARFVANTPADPDHLAALTDLGRHPVGLRGRVARDAGGVLTFTITGEGDGRRHGGIPGSGAPQ